MSNTFKAMTAMMTVQACPVPSLAQTQHQLSWNFYQHHMGNQVNQNYSTVMQSSSQANFQEEDNSEEERHYELAALW